MSIETDIFCKHTPDFEKLIEYGFKKNNTKYIYEKLFQNNNFKTIIEITDSGTVSAKVYDLENNDEFLPLKVKNIQGGFVGGVKEEYKTILTDIRNNCFSQNYFVSSQANRITDAIIKKYGDNPDFMWEKFDGFGVFKNTDNNKWYGIIMNITYSKLGLNDNTPVEVINVKLNKDKIQELLKQDGFYPAWHMNKKYWITITLDETLSDDKILNFIEESYSYTVKPKRSPSTKKLQK